MDEKSPKELIPNTLMQVLGVLNEAEELFLKRVVTDGITNLCVGYLDEAKDDFKKRTSWKTNRYIRASLLEWFFKDDTLRRRANSKGLLFRSIKIVGYLDLSQIPFEYNLTFWHCVIRDPIMLWKGETKDIEFVACELGSINAERAIIDGQFRIEGCRVRGNLNFLNCVVSTQFLMLNSVQRTKDMIGVECSNISAMGNLSFDNCRLESSVVISSGNIKGTLRFRHSKLSSIVEPAIDVMLTNIDRDCVIENCSFRCSKESVGSIRLQGTVIDRRLFLFRFHSKVNAALDLSDAQCLTFCDDETSWPNPGKLEISGFRYSRIDRYGSLPHILIDKRIKWLQLQPEPKPKQQFSAQPWLQLAKTYRDHGDEEAAKLILINKEEHQRRHLGSRVYVLKTKFLRSVKFKGAISTYVIQVWKAGKVLFPLIVSWGWKKIIGFAIVYGYRPGRALFIMFCFIVVGSFFFSYAHSERVLQSGYSNVSKEVVEADFCAPIYAVDLFVPFLDLNQDKHWSTASSFDMQVDGKVVKQYVSCYWLFHLLYVGYIGAGWFFSTLLAASLTGLWKKD